MTANEQCLLPTALSLLAVLAHFRLSCSKLLEITRSGIFVAEWPSYLVKLKAYTTDTVFGPTCICLYVRWRSSMLVDIVSANML